MGFTPFPQSIAGRQRRTIESLRVVNNLHANWQFDSAMQLGLQYGVRYVSSTFDGEEYAGVSDIAGLDLWRQLNPRFDFGWATTSPASAMRTSRLAVTRRRAPTCRSASRQTTTHSMI
jgi:hypothetical protein